MKDKAMIICTRCDGTGFLNIGDWIEEVEEWLSHEEIRKLINRQKEHDDRFVDAQVCDCCGDGEYWYGEPGHHYGPDDPAGKDGPYAYNGGLCECH